MKTKLLMIILIFSFVGLIAQQKDGAKLQKADESGFIEVDKAPVLKSQLKPAYPELAKLSGIEGTVYLKLLIDETGNVEKAKVEQGVKDMLDNSALEAAKKAKFSPALLDNKPIKAWIVLPIAFKLSVDKKAEGRLLKYDELGPPPSNVKDDEPNISAFVPVEKLPEMIEGTKPVYPELAKKAGIEGKVFVKVLIDKEGNPRKAVVIKSEAEVLNQSAIDAATKSKFTPAINKGNPIPVWIVLPYRFSLGKLEKGETELFEKIDEAKESYKEFVSLYEASPEVQKTIFAVPNKNIKFEKISSKISFGDESSVYKITEGSNTRYDFIARSENVLYKYRGVKSLEEIQNYVDELKVKERKKIDYITISVNSDEPSYPKEAIEKELRGEVLVKVYFEDNNLEKVETIKSNSNILDKAAEEIVKANFFRIYDGIIKGEKMIFPDEKDFKTRFSSISYPYSFTLSSGQIIRVNFILQK